MKEFRLPRKTKKELKKLILKDKDPAWKTKECKITSITKHYRYSDKRPTFNGISVTGYTLGI